MKFAHLADCHIGSYREPKLNNLSSEAFTKAIDKCISEQMDFILISGDLFNTSLPPIDKLKSAVTKLKELKDNNISAYMIAGSHDFSPTGKTMLDVLEEAGLIINVVKGDVTPEGKLILKFTTDKKTRVKIAGMLGKKGMLEKKYYEDLDKSNLESESGYKIFMFHTALTEFKPKELADMDSAPLSLLPKGFNYYAGGHVHYIYEKDEAGYGKIVYPGPLFPNNFRELEKLQNGGFYIVEDGKTRYEPLHILNVESIKINCDHLTPPETTQQILENIKNKEFLNTIVTIRAEGKLKLGKPSDVDWKEIYKQIYDKSAYFIMKNTNKLTSPEFEEIKIQKEGTEEIEEEMIKEHVGQIKIEGMIKGKEYELAKKIIQALSTEKQEGEKNNEFENRIKKEMNKILELE